MKGAVCFAVRDVGARYAFHVGGLRFDVGDDRHLDDRMPRVVSLKLVAALDRAKLVRCMNLDSDGANLTRLDDFFEVKVTGRASARRRPPRSYSSGEKVIIWAPHRRSDTVGGRG